MKEKNCKYFPECGGCDFLDLSEEEYRKLKQKNFWDIAKNFIPNFNFGVEWVWVEAHSRRRLTFQVDAKNQLGFFVKKSNKNIVAIDACFAAEQSISDLILPLKKLLTKQEQNFFHQIIITSFEGGLDMVCKVKREPNFSQIQKLTDFARDNNCNASYQFQSRVTPVFLLRKNQILCSSNNGFEFKIDLNSNAFIQATKLGLAGIVAIISDFVKNNFLDKIKVVDLYSGFGIYSFVISQFAKSVFAFEGSETMVLSIRSNAIANGVEGKIKAEIRDLFFNPLGLNELRNFDLIIINPPRNGASPQILEISKIRKKSALIYISCNPESFFRDAKILLDSGFYLLKLVVLDQFFGTSHLEIVAIFTTNP